MTDSPPVNPATQAGPEIKKSDGLTLPPEVQSVLTQMFAGYLRLIVQAEFGTGLSGSRVFLVRPIRHDEKPELPAVVKIAAIDQIKKEWRAYNEYIRDRLPDITEVRGEQVLPRNSTWGGLRYVFTGGGAFEVQSLLTYSREASAPELCSVLEEQLFKIMDQIWLHHRAQADFSMQASYDALLPVNLLIEPASPPPDVAWCLLKPHEPIDRQVAKNAFVKIEGFVITEVDASRASVTLNLPAPTPGSGAAYRIRLCPVEAIDQYCVGNVIAPVAGKVLATRDDLLRDELRRALGSAFDLDHATITLTDRAVLPNPLIALPGILDESRDVRVAAIHGDLNLENILIEPRGRNPAVYLIDFATAREDHVLHDLLRLETEIVTRIMPAALATAKLPAETICAFYERLHLATGYSDRLTTVKAPQSALEKPFQILIAIRKKAAQYLYDPTAWAEYYQGLTLYLLGALKFKNLEAVSKQIAFFGAAEIQQLLKQPPRIEKPPRRKLKTAGAAAVVIGIAAILWLGRLLSAPTAPDASNSLAVMGALQGKVKVQRHDNELITAFTGLLLYREDVITSLPDSWAYIHCLRSGLFKLAPGRVVVLTCAPNPSDGLELIAQTLPAEVSALTDKAAAPITPSLASLASVRGNQSVSLADVGQVPLLLSPRQLTAESHPIFRWLAVSGAEAYTLKVEGKSDQWSVRLPSNQLSDSGTRPFILPQTAVVEVAYPADAPPLKPNTTYLVTLQAYLPGLPSPQEADEALFFELVDDETAASLTAASTQIRGLTTPDNEKAYLFSLLYQQHNLWVAAADQLEVVARLNSASPPLIQLGDTYLKAGLGGLAEANYQRALETAQSNDDAYTQGAALIGLGQAAYATQNQLQATGYFQQALTLYRQLKEDRAAKIAESLLQEISSP